MVFHNGSKYAYHFMIKYLAEEFKEQFECLLFECLLENIEKYIMFSAPIKEGVKRFDKRGNDVKRVGKRGEEVKTELISCKIRSIDSVRFMPSLISILVDNLAERPHSSIDTDFKSDLEYLTDKEKYLYSNKNCEKRN